MAQWYRVSNGTFGLCGDALEYARVGWGDRVSVHTILGEQVACMWYYDGARENNNRILWSVSGRGYYLAHNRPTRDAALAAARRRLQTERG